MSQEQTYTVGAVTRYIKQRLELDPVLKDFWVTGEISNLTQHGSGHVYFSLKDQEAQLSCAMFKGVAMRYRRNMPKHGTKVRLRGEVSVYPPRGSYQMIVREMVQAGAGDLHQRFIALRDKLKEEGLFDPQFKKPIPKYPKKIGIATSATGAVIRDIVDTVKRRFPHVQLLLVPTVVQGDAAANSIVKSLTLLNALEDVDVIILARGGGSLEDLWCFNEEKVARAIFASRLPVISGVGHETDTTIADFVADLRAATPTAAAELAVPSIDELKAGLAQAEAQLGRSLKHFIEVRQQMLDDYAWQLQTTILNQMDKLRQQVDNHESQMVNRTLNAVHFKRQVLDDQKERLDIAVLNMIQAYRTELEKLELQLQNFDFRSVLDRGFSMTVKDGKPVTDASKLKKNDEVTTFFKKGKAIAKIQEKSNSYGDR
mgnify:CR=1 FL=1